MLDTKTHANYIRRKWIKSNEEKCQIKKKKKLLFRNDFQKVDQHTGGKWLVNPRHQTLQEPSIAKPGTAL